MTDQPRARTRNSAGLIIEAIGCEPVAVGPNAGCNGCMFNSGNARGCIDHACMPAAFPADHPLHGKRAIWVRKTT